MTNKHHESSFEADENTIPPTAATALYAYGPVAGPLTREGADAGVAAALAGKCPRCDGRLLDLRGTGFNALAVEREGTCFWWAEDAYTCVRRGR